MAKDRETAQLPVMMNGIQIQVPILTFRDGEYNMGRSLSIEMYGARHRGLDVRVHGPLVKIAYMTDEGKTEVLVAPLAGMLSALKTMAVHAESAVQESGRWIMENEG